MFSIKKLSLNTLFLMILLYGESFGCNEILKEVTHISNSHKGILGEYTFITRLSHNPEKIKSFKQDFDFPTINNELTVETFHPYQQEDTVMLMMGEKKIVQDKSLTLFTQGLIDCIGITAWEPESKVAALYHASKMELNPGREHMFIDYFIKPLKEKIYSPSNTIVNLVSCYWSDNVLKAISILQENGFSITGLNIPEALVENTEFELNFYINKETASPSYFNVPRASMAISTQDGRVGYQFN